MIFRTYSVDRHVQELTNEQLDRLYRRVYQRATGGMGYQPYGVDWPTLCILHPDLAYALRAVNAECMRRASAVGRTGDTW